MLFSATPSIGNGILLEATEREQMVALNCSTLSDFRKPCWLFNINIFA